MVIFIIVIALYLGLNALVFKSLLGAVAAWPLSAKIGVSVVYWVLAVSFVLFQVFHHKLPMRVAHISYWVANGWLVVFLYLLIALGVFSILHWFGVDVHYKWGISLGIIAVALIFGFIHFDHPIVKKLLLSDKNFLK